MENAKDMEAEESLSRCSHDAQLWQLSRQELLPSLQMA